MINAEKQAQIAFELALARQAQAEGMEGRARVCARRAVGVALRHYFAQRQPAITGTSVIDLIQAYQGSAGLPRDLYDICTHLLTRVDMDYHLPFPVDILAEARLLIDAILEDGQNS